ncbi:MAG TPA: amidohydrolase family protein [Acetobacteraceae bacterium]|nr:amidohydrolase family protein [Acetobacteraceae bacterium]
MRPDLILRGGHIIDGSGAPGFGGDVAVAGGRIQEIGVVPQVEGAEEIYTRGLTVAPGFIDIHSHSDLTLLVDPRALSAVAQGVTTEVVGNCGHGCAPITDPAIAKAAIYGPVHAAAFDWRSIAGYLEKLEAARPAVNVVTLVPNGQLRLAVVGADRRAATPDELGRMEQLLAEALEQGAAGFSTGLEYAQEGGATEMEVTALCKVVARVDGLYATHTRDRDAHAVAAVAEAVRTVRAAGVRLQVSHIVPRSGAEVTAQCLAVIDAARASGIAAEFDMHTRTFGFTHLKNLLPGWVLEGGADEIAARLRDGAARARIAAHRNLITSLGDWERVQLVHSDRFEPLNGLSFAEIGRSWSVAPLDAALRILLGHVDDILRPMVILQSYSEDLLRDTYAHPRCMVGSDATTLAPTARSRAKPSTAPTPGLRGSTAAWCARSDCSRRRRRSSDFRRCPPVHSASAIAVCSRGAHAPISWRSIRRRSARPERSRHPIDWRAACATSSSTVS